MERYFYVEGTDDEHVLKNLCGKASLGNFVFEPESRKTQGGVDKLEKSLRTFLKSRTEPAIVGVIVDADGNLTKRWGTLKRALQQAGYTSVPEGPQAQGTIIDPLQVPDNLLPRVGIWIMPDNKASGALEDFLLSIIPQPSPLLDHAEKAIDSIPSGSRLFPESALKKAKVHTYLAWQEKPGQPYGLGIKSGSFDSSKAEAQNLIAWIKSLFQLP